MNGRKQSVICLVRGPLMLIALGLLLAVDQLGYHSFGRTWPVLIILFGLLKLAERLLPAQPAGAPSAPPGGTQ